MREERRAEPGQTSGATVILLLIVATVLLSMSIDSTLSAQRF